MATIGFVTYEDFRNEVRDAGVRTVRMQDYVKRRRNSAGVNEAEIYVELAADNGTDTYVCRFSFGGGWDVPVDSERAKLDRAQENAERAMEILRGDLERMGVQVRPGLIAAAQESQVATTGPWEWVKDGQGLPLIAGSPGEEQ
jgi:hypothetical protein